MQKKKKITKNSRKSCFWHFRKTAKKYIIKNTYIYLHTNYISIYTAEPQRLRMAWRQGADVVTVPYILHQNSSEANRRRRMGRIDWGVWISE